MLAADNAEGLDTRALLVVQDGRILAEAYAPGISKDTPLLGWSSPASRPSRVDLPEPDAPVIASVSPAATTRSTSLRMTSGPSAVTTRCDRARARTIPSPAGG